MYHHEARRVPKAHTSSKAKVPGGDHSKPATSVPPSSVTAIPASIPLPVQVPTYEKEIQVKIDVEQPQVKKPPAKATAPAIRSLRPPKIKPVAKTFQRPSLSEQLKGFMQNTSSFIRELKGSEEADSPYREPCLCEIASAHYIVGKLECKLSGSIRFLDDRAAYRFQHPHSLVEIQMDMYYSDMQHAQLDVARKRLSFKIPRVLEHFGDSYQPSHPNHWLAIQFFTETDVAVVKAQAWVVIRRAAAAAASR